MKLAHISDLHLSGRNSYEWNETTRLMNWLTEDIHSWGPDLILLAGDMSPGGQEVRSASPTERLMLISWYQRLADSCPVVIVKGNHDHGDEDIAVYRQIRAAHQIYAFNGPGVIDVPSVGYVVGFPWPSKGYLLTRRDGATSETVDDHCRSAIRAILFGLGVEIVTKRDDPVVFVGHLNVRGADVGGFTLVGQDVEVSPEDLSVVGANYYGLGHIHKRQSFGSRIHYCGSPRRVDFGEENETKGYLRATLDQPEFGMRWQDVEPVVEFRETPIAPMQTIRIATNSGRAVPGPIVTESADVRVIVTIEEEFRAMFNEAELLETLGVSRASRVRPVEYHVIPKERVRAPRIVEAVTDADRLMTYLETLDPQPSSETIQHLLDKLMEVTA